MVLARARLIFNLIVCLVALGSILPPAQANPVSANDGADTRVTQNGNRFNIEGGSFSRDRANLFHSFQEFGLSRDQIVNFLSNPEIRSIFARVTGGNVSRINGVLQIQGGNSNLFLMNPAGIVFGRDARLNLPASFTATTANGIGFGDSWFSASGTNDYASFVGNPAAFAFTMERPGAILTSDLKLESGGQLSLVAGTIRSDGLLRVPGGDVILSSVPGESVVRISQPGNMLQLEVESLAITGDQPEAWGLPILSLPELLTGSDEPNVSPGSIRTEAIDTSTNNGNGGSVGLNANRNIVTDRINSSTDRGNGGRIRLDAEFGSIQTGILTSASDLGDGGNIRLRSNGNIVTRTVDSRSGLGDGSTFSIEYSEEEDGTSRTRDRRTSFRYFINTNDNEGQGGNLSLNSQVGSVVVNGDLFSFAISDAGGAGSVNIQALERIQVNDINSSGFSGNGGDISLSTEQGQIQAGAVSAVSYNGNGGIINFLSSDSITTNDLQSVSYRANSGNITVEARRDITVGNVSSGTFTLGNDSGGDITLRSTTGDVFTDLLFSEASLDFSQIGQQGGLISLQSSGVVRTSAIFTSDGGGLSVNAPQPQLGTISNGFFDTSITDANISIQLTEVPPNVTLQSTDAAARFDQTQIVEQRRQEEFEEYFGLGKEFNRQFASSDYIAQTLKAIEEQTRRGEAQGNHSAVVYLVTEGGKIYLQVETTELSGNPVSRKVQLQDTREQLKAAVDRLNEIIQDPTSSQEEYLNAASKVYGMLITPLETGLGNLASEIDTFLFSMDSGLRLLPLAALYDQSDEEFFVEKYSFSIIPNFSSTDFRYTNLQNAEVLAMGASEFPAESGFSALAAVPLELASISEAGRSTQVFLNQNFTLEQLRQSRQQRPFQIVHLATHADFLPGDPSNSSIQLGDSELQLDPLQLRLLDWDAPSIDLLVLSACNTALGSQEAELGFAGLALQSGVKSALASLWLVGDLGSLVLMQEFYKQLDTAPTKAQALQKAQLAMIQDPSRILDNLQELQTLLERSSALPALAQLSIEDRQRLATRLNVLIATLEEGENPFAHPFYWASFTLIGSPW